MQTELAARKEAVDWVKVAEITKATRGIPLSVSAGEDLSTVLANAVRVQNRIPEGANWDGADDPARAEQTDVRDMVAEQQQAPRS